MSRRKARRTVVVRRRSRAAPVRTRTRYVRVRRAGRRAYSAVASRKEKFGIGIAAAAWGYFKSKNPNLLDKIPSVAGFGKELTAGLVIALLFKPRRGGWVDHLSTALISIGAYNFGFAQASGTTVQGDDDLSGDMD